MMLTNKVLANKSVLSAKSVTSKPLPLRTRSIVVRAGGEQPSTPPPPQEPTPTPTPTPTPPANKAVSVGEAFAFSGPLPEKANGRLAMLGFVAALGAELSTGQPVVTQFSEATAPILATAVAFTVASLVPLLKGANQSEAMGPFTPQAEMTNGRMAMIGMASLIGYELLKGTALF